MLEKEDLNEICEISKNTDNDKIYRLFTLIINILSMSFILGIGLTIFIGIWGLVIVVVIYMIKAFMWVV